MSKDDWVLAAMMDDTVVVELLVRLKKWQPSPLVTLPLFRWGLRQPRSRQSTRCDGFSVRKSAATELTRKSPTTPLSWSGGAGSLSVTADGLEASSRPRSNSPNSRSKVNIVNETATSASKRARKRKTFAELKEEEHALLKERVYLRKEIATLHANCKEQRTTNERLKRIKLDLNLQTETENVSANLDKPRDEPSRPSERRMESSISIDGSSVLSMPATTKPASRGPQTNDSEAAQDRQNFTLPDLNVTPSEAESCCDTPPI